MLNLVYADSALIATYVLGSSSQDLVEMLSTRFVSRFELLWTQATESGCDGAFDCRRYRCTPLGRRSRGPDSCRSAS